VAAVAASAAVVAASAAGKFPIRDMTLLGRLYHCQIVLNWAAWVKLADPAWAENLTH